MKNTVEALKRISGNVPDEKIIAREFCTEATTEAEARAKRISDICDLSVIIDVKVLSQATDALAGIRHLTACVADVAEFHSNGSLGTDFAKLLVDLVSLRDKSEAKYLWLCKLIPSNTTV